jgi:hypothetical protein
MEDLEDTFTLRQTTYSIPKTTSTLQHLSKPKEDLVKIKDMEGLAELL